MKRLLCIALSVIMVLSILAACEGNSNEQVDNNITGVFSVGYAKADITPAQPVPLAGYGDNAERISTGVLDPLYATCIAFTDAEGNTVILFNLDLGQTPTELITAIRERISEEAGIPTDHVHMSASHTHNAYDASTTALAGVVNANNNFIERCVEAAKAALADRKPAQMYGSFARPDGLNFVRHYILSDGTMCAFRLGQLPRDQIYGHIWKADNLLQVIKFTRDGGKDVVMINWQSHYYGTGDANYYSLSADYIGAMRNELEAQLDCHAAFVLGGSGNLNCTSQIKTENHNKGYQEHGKMLAAAAIESMDNMQPLETGTIHVLQNHFVVPETVKKNELTAFGFGDFGMVFAPWEIFDVHARGVRDDSKYTYTFYASCASGSWGNHYLPHDAAFDYSCYEVSTTYYPRGTAELIQATLTELINKCFDESGQTQKTRADGYNSTPFVPVTDGKEYTNLSVGDITSFPPTLGGFYSGYFTDGTNVKYVLIETEELVKQICELATVKFLFDDRGIVVGIA